MKKLKPWIKELIGYTCFVFIGLLVTYAMCLRAEQIDKIDAKKELSTYHETNG